MPDFLLPEIFRTIVEQIDVGIYIIDTKRMIRFWNRGAERITGFLAQDVVGRLCRDNILAHCNDSNPCLCASECPLMDTMREGVARPGQVYLRHHQGHRLPVEIHAVPLRDELGKVVGAAEIFTEHVTLPEVSSQNLVFAACGCLDEETGTPNHELTESYLREQWDLFETHHIPFAVFVVRADHLSEFAAQHGHEACVAILSAVGRTLRHALRATDFLGRWSEDRFLVMLPYSGRAPLMPTVERLRNVVNCTAIPWWGDLLSVRVSAGLVQAEPGESLADFKVRIENCLPNAVKPSTSAESAGA